MTAGDGRRVAVITGAARGIGAGIARRMGGDGAMMLLADIDGEALEQSGRALRDAGATVQLSPGDLSTPDAAAQLIAAAHSEWGRVDVLVNNAGGGVIRPYLDHDAASIAETLSRNLLTTIHCCRAVLPGMVERRSGRIVNLGAESVRNGLTAHAMYNAAKGGVHGLTTGLAREFAPYGITVNCVAPSIVATEPVRQWQAADPASLPALVRDVLKVSVDLIPIGRPAEIDEVAAAVAFLASEEASFVTGQVVSVNGGSSML